MSIVPDPVLYEIYVRSFADHDGDGIGDIRGITSRLDHFVELGVHGIWLTPIFASPQADFGYDVSDYRAVHDEYGTLQDVDRLIRQAHRRGIRVILDMVLGHTSRAHPWFRERPDWYVWSEEVPNNWLSVFGGSAWEYEPAAEKYYYHRFYAEQPTLDWRNPDVRKALHEVIRFWADRGVDGFRLDAFDGLFVDPRLRDEPVAATAGIRGRENDNWADFWSLDHIHTSDLPEVHDELRSLRAEFPATAFLVEADLPNAALRPYTAVADSAFSFEFFRTPLDGEALAAIVDGAGADGALAWALSNHDKPRLVSRWGRHRAAIAAVLLLTLPGWSFIYQGDEIGMVNGPGGPVEHDRNGRDAVRHPMQWSADGGFTTGTPWLPLIDPAECNVADQSKDGDSTLALYRALIRLRRTIEGEVKVLRASPDSLVYRRGPVSVHLNFGAGEIALEEASGEVLLATRELTGARRLPADSAAILRSS